VEVIYFPKIREATQDNKKIDEIKGIIAAKAREITDIKVYPKRELKKEKEDDPLKNWRSLNDKELGKLLDKEIDKIMREDLDAEQVSFYINLTNKINQTLIFECYTDSSQIFIKHVQLVPKEGLKFLNEPIYERNKNRYQGPLFYHLSIVSIKFKYRRHRMHLLSYLKRIQ